MTTESYVRRRAKQMGYTLIQSGNPLEPRYALVHRGMILFGGIDRNGHVLKNACSATLDQLRTYMCGTKWLFERALVTGPTVKEIMDKALRP